MATVQVTVDADGGTNDWYQPLVGDHFDDINDPDDPLLDNIYSTQSQGDDGDIEQFSIEPVDLEGDVCSQLVVWTHGWISGAHKPEIQIDIGGETHGPVDVPLTEGGGVWRSNTFTPDGDDWTEAECSALKLTYIADCAVEKENATIYAVKLIFTYPDPAPEGYGHDYMGVPAANIGSVSGVPNANIANIKGV